MAARIATLLGDESARVVSSPLRRARATAEEIARIVGAGHVEVIDALVRMVVDPPDAAAAPDIVYNVVTRIRLPRITASLLIGANLAVTGVAFQGIFRNPLVDSNILGVTSGAGFGAALMLSPIAGAFGLAAFALTFVARKLGSLASLAGVLMTACVHLVIHPIEAHLWAGAAMVAVIVLRHEANISALLEGRERSFG